MFAHWREPDMIVKSALAFMKVMHVLAGVEWYGLHCAGFTISMPTCLSSARSWQFFTNLDFDWSLLTGRRPRRWTFWVYMACRITGVGIAVTVLIMLDSTGEIDCQATILALFVLAIISYALALLLTVLRVIAIWDRYGPIVALSAFAWLTSVAFWIRVIPEVHLTPHSPFSQLQSASACFITSSPQFLPLSVATLLVYATLLTTMIVGLLRKPHKNSVGIWRLLYHQGLSWLALAILAEVPTLVLQVPRVLTTTMAATMMYRALHNYTTISEHEVEAKRPVTVQPGMPKPGSLSILPPLEVAVHTTFEQHCDEDEPAISPRSKSTGSRSPGYYGRIHDDSTASVVGRFPL
ncbi:hypothetical protein FA95DRAFT_1611781 [Auriscalpium vulgare]|uniref:Uncharacterized protein n=1 Tax=Auriscalpium vulgare TaxID=40419 RepID=A0ACB8R8G2_9AGAM|nr:hypothetical protein FA95DRAFT_1611781 [Auriscalpium vulgare]